MRSLLYGSKWGTRNEVLQFGFDGNPQNEHLPHNYEKDTVAYSGTHDNETVLGYFSTREEEHKRAAFIVMRQI